MGSSLAMAPVIAAANVTSVTRVPFSRRSPGRALPRRAAKAMASAGGAENARTMASRRALMAGVATMGGMAWGTGDARAFDKAPESFVPDTLALKEMLDKLFTGKGDGIKYADFVALADPWESNYKYNHIGYNGVWLVMLKAKLAASVQFKKSGALDDPNAVFMWKEEETIYNNETVISYLRKCESFLESECGDSCIKPFSV